MKAVFVIELVIIADWMTKEAQYVLELMGLPGAGGDQAREWRNNDGVGQIFLEIRQKWRNFAG